ncbi:MAG TPA: hypothetical protein VED84_06670 [Acidimicrobiales bacterium]|nr:hypothetical protein [Acidimicrobiales bacterium]
MSRRRAREFWHFTLGGEHSIDEEEILDEVIESVTCRWCGKSASVGVFAEAEPPPAAVGGSSPQETTPR